MPEKIILRTELKSMYVNIVKSVTRLAILSCLRNTKEREGAREELADTRKEFNSRNAPLSLWSV